MEILESTDYYDPDAQAFALGALRKIFEHEGLND
jgi:hypothetical protein